MHGETMKVCFWIQYSNPNLLKNEGF